MLEDEEIVELFFTRSEQAIQELDNKYGNHVFFLLFAIKLHFFLGVFLHFITGADRIGNRKISVGIARKFQVYTLKHNNCA